MTPQQMELQDRLDAARVASERAETRLAASRDKDGWVSTVALADADDARRRVVTLERVSQGENQ